MTTRARIAALVLAGSLATGCRPDCTPAGGTTRPNVLLVTIDTLRADHLGCYGSRTVRTPVLDRLAAEGALFERTWAQAPITVPSHISILSSLPLAVHGVTRNDGPPARQVDVLPGLFARAGYRTAAFVSVRHLGPGSVLAPLLGGLEEYRAPKRVSQPWRAEETNAQVFPWLRHACRDPWFTWVHYYDPHMPYAPPAPFDTAYYDGDPYTPYGDGMAGVRLNWFFLDLKGLRKRLARRAPAIRALKRDLGLRTRAVKDLVLDPTGLGAFAPDAAAREALRARLRAIADPLRAELPYRDLARWLTGVRDPRFPLARYAGEVSYVDAQLGRLRAELERLGIAGRTIVLVTADHGECLGEHGVYFDHFGLFEPSLRVPLIVWAPGRVAPGRHAATARGLDVAPTLLGLAGLPVPPAMEGRDLFRATAPDDEPVISESSRGLQVMARLGPWKLIRTLDAFCYVDAFTRDTGARELYDEASDPAENDDRVAREPERATALGAALDRWLTAQHPAPDRGGTPRVNPEVESALRALGYVE